MYVSTLTNIEISTLFTQINEEKFDLDSPYQRDIVWDTSKQSLFINSIMKGIIPSPLIFASNDDNGIRTVIDGKQRITSIVRFKRNEIPVHITGNNLSETIYYDLIPLDNSIKKDSRIMSNQEKSRFNNTNLNCVTYQGISYEDQLLIFNRIQNGVCISSADLLKASAKNESSNNRLNKFYEELEPVIGAKYSNNSNKEKNNHIILITNIMYMVKNKKLKTYTKADRIIAVQNCEDVLEQVSELIKNVFAILNLSDKKLCNYMLYPYIYYFFNFGKLLDVDKYYKQVKAYTGKKEFKNIYDNVIFPSS